VNADVWGVVHAETSLPRAPAALTEPVLQCFRLTTPESAAVKKSSRPVPGRAVASELPHLDEHERAGIRPSRGVVHDGVGGEPPFRDR